MSYSVVILLFCDREFANEICIEANIFCKQKPLIGIIHLVRSQNYPKI